MKKYFIVLLTLTSTQFIFSQKNEKLNDVFQAQQQKNIAKYDALKKIKDSTSKSSELFRKAISSITNTNQPIFTGTEDVRANNSSNITAIRSGAVTGLNGFIPDGTNLNIMVMDGGKIWEKHNEFGGPSVSPLRVIDKENNERGYSAHSTNVAGILGAQGSAANALGVLPKVTFNNYYFYETSFGNMFVKLNNANANISNHSYGVNLGWANVTTTGGIYANPGYYWLGDYSQGSQDTWSGGYHAEDQNYDMIVYSNPTNIVVKSTGNYYGIKPAATDKKYKWDPNANAYVEFAATDILPDANCSLGYNCIGFGALAKNIITVQAANQLTTSGNLYTTSTDVVKYTYGSAGPRRDGGIKPDITAVGVLAYVPNYTNSTTYSGYANATGTSIAAPQISGIAGALTQIQQNLSGNSAFTFKVDEMKALLTHTANEAGRPGPDVWFGWGLADAKKAAELLINKKDNKVTFERNTLTSGSPYTKQIVSDGTPLKATISWVDPAAVPVADNLIATDLSSRIINDLDLRIVDTSDNSVYYPWKLDNTNFNANAIKGDNTVDNVEQVLIDAPVSGRIYRVEVTNKGTLVNDSGNATPSAYALIITGYNPDAVLAASYTDLAKTIAVYPARTKDFVTVVIPVKASEISVYDMSGKQVLRTAAKSTQLVDLSSLSKGVYIFSIKTEKGTVSKKIIKE
ncbi:S8 family peptidase [uncultured Chryseobacterium sp.]|uniref:S8 family peptidase n=1 Tax=uncultured Chryseobacterium sp. TaxID=259322 RepID=UPI002617D229|nr:S8 family peptidase [uncultured Chryseobacterium sp.]